MLHTNALSDMVGPYRVEAVLGQGQFGRVFLARDEKGRRIAVKTLYGVGARDRDLMQRELEIGAKSISPHVVRVLDFDLDAPNPWLAMEYVEGDDLTRLIENRELSEPRVRKIATELAHGLDALSRRGIVHRDLKPHNVRIGVADSVKIIDMGMATRTAMARSIAGTPAYMAPEVLISGESTPKSDIWSFGVIIAQMLTGEAPTYLNGSIESVLRRVPSAWRGLVRSCLSVDPSNRPTAAQLVQELDPSATVFVPAVRRQVQPRPRVSAPAVPRPDFPVPARMRPVGPPRSARTALALALILGVYGGHRFYLGYHREGAIQMFTAGGFFVWLIMDISDIVAGRMTDVDGQPLVGPASPREVGAIVLDLAAICFGALGLLFGMSGLISLSEGDPTGPGGIALAVIMLSVALLRVFFRGRKAISLRRQRLAEDRLKRIDALERELGLASSRVAGASRR